MHLTLQIGLNIFGQGFKFFFGQTDFVPERHFPHFVQGNQVNVGVRHFETYDGHPNSVARNGFFQGHGNFFGKLHQSQVQIVIEVKKSVDFFFGTHKVCPFAFGLMSKKAKKLSSSAIL